MVDLLDSTFVSAVINDSSNRSFIIGFTDCSREVIELSALTAYVFVHNLLWGNIKSGKFGVHLSQMFKENIVCVSTNFLKMSICPPVR